MVANPISLGCVMMEQQGREDNCSIDVLLLVIYKLIVILNNETLRGHVGGCGSWSM